MALWINGGVALYHTSVVHWLTPLLCGIGCVQFWTTAGDKTRGVQGVVDGICVDDCPVKCGHRVLDMARPPWPTLRT